VLVTHDQEEALSIADRVAVMNGGRLLQVAAPATIYRQPADAFVARFIGAAAVLAGIAGAGTVRVGGLDLPASAASDCASGSSVEMFLRPEHVRVAAMNGQIPAGMVAAEVEETTFLGSLTRLRLRLLEGPSDAAPLWADLPSGDTEQFQAGARVVASWDEASPRVLPC